jgi:hypothetical protein
LSISQQRVKGRLGMAVAVVLGLNGVLPTLATKMNPTAAKSQIWF